LVLLGGSSGNGAVSDAAAERQDDPSDPSDLSDPSNQFQETSP
jgi:hypothetical protein